MPDPEAKPANELPKAGETNTFTEKKIRLGFIRKMYAILSVQFLITVGIIALFIFVEPVKKLSETEENHMMVYVAMSIYIILVVLLDRCESVVRKSPQNQLMLLGLALSEGVFLGCLWVYWWGQPICIAVGITAVVTVVLTCFSFQKKRDITMRGGMLLVFVTVLLVFIVLIIFFRKRILILVSASLGALLFSTYIVFDTQMMVKKHHDYSISPEEYTFAAIHIFTDLNLASLIMFTFWLVRGCKDIEDKD